MPSPHHVSMRVDDATLARIADVQTALDKPYHAATQSDALRCIVLAGLDALARPNAIAKASRIVATVEPPAAYVVHAPTSGSRTRGSKR